MKVEITLLDNTVFITEIENYDAQVIADSINSPDKFMVAIGDIVVNGRNIRTIIMVDTEEVLA